MACRCLRAAHVETFSEGALSPFAKSFVCKYCTVYIYMYIHKRYEKMEESRKHVYTYIKRNKYTMRNIIIYKLRNTDKIVRVNNHTRI